MSETPRAWSITDFLTTGSLAALVEESGRLLGARITLHDLDARRIRSVAGDPPWRIDPSPDPGLAEQIRELAGAREPIRRAERSLIPIHVAGGEVGALAIGFEPGIDEGRRSEIERVLSLVAQTAAEFCDENVVNRRRTSELALLLRISSLLVSTRDLDHSLSVALDASIDTFNADAGTIHLLDEESGTLRLRAGAGVGQAFLDDFAELPRDRVIDQDVLRGDVICVPDLANDGAAMNLERIRDEGLVGLISVGLLFRKNAFGIMRLYARRPLSITQEERALARAVAEQVSGAIAGARLIEAEQRQRRHQRALAIAADIQRRMLPNAPPRLPGLEVAARYIPSLELGGDFYDLIELGGHLGVVVGDVVGKGIPAALLMAGVRASLRAHATDVYHIDEIIRRVNRALARDTHPNEFATLFYGVIDPASLRLTYCNAGHDPPMILRRAMTEPDTTIDIVTLTEGGMVVGVLEDAPYTPATFQLRRGDLLLAYTDGLPDTMNFKDEKLGVARVRDSLVELLRATPDATPEHAINHLVWEANRFAGLRPKVDDMTLVGVRVGV